MKGGAGGAGAEPGESVGGGDVGEDCLEVELL